MKQNRLSRLCFVLMCMLCAVVYLFPMNSEKVLKKHNVPVEKINKVYIMPLKIEEAPETIDIQPGNRQLTQFLNGLKVRRAIPGEVKSVMTFYHDGYDFFWDDGVRRYNIKVVPEEWLVIEESGYKIV